MTHSGHRFCRDKEKKGINVIVIEGNSDGKLPLFRIPAPRPKLILCTSEFPGPGNDPPPHLCDIVVYDAGYEDLSKKPFPEAKLFKNYCKKKEAACGINIGWLKDILQQLGKPETKTVVADYYAAGIKHYGLLRSPISVTTKEADMKLRIDVLKKLATFMTVTSSDRDTLFWGVATRLAGATTPPDSMVQLFLHILKTVPINLVVYDTSYHWNVTKDAGTCVSTGPAMWKSAPLPDQSTFVDSLNFWKAVRTHALPGIAEMLAFTLCGYWTEFTKGTAVQKLGAKAECQKRQWDYVENYICSGGSAHGDYVQAVLDPDAIEYIGMDKAKSWVVAYDMEDTIVKKVCMASVNYGFDGGWMVHSLQCHFKQLCGGTDVGGFPSVRVVNNAARVLDLLTHGH